jgi:hypothetical protein
MNNLGMFRARSNAMWLKANPISATQVQCPVRPYARSKGLRELDAICETSAAELKENITLFALRIKDWLLFYSSEGIPSRRRRYRKTLAFTI